jgi:signal transduction histidine kinase
LSDAINPGKLLAETHALAMRGLIFIFLGLNAFTALVGGARGQAPDHGPLQGVVTLADAQRKLLVIQEGKLARAVRLDGDMPPVRLGDRIHVGGQVNPWFTAFPDFPAHPAGQKILAAFEVPTDWNDHFIARLRGFLRVPADGDYTFWIMADDEGELFLGSSSDPATARRIAAAPRGSWPPPWDRDPGQKSQSVHLKAGERYYIEARQIEWRGHDLLAVAWEGATFRRELLRAEFLSPWPADDGATNGILYEYWTNCFLTSLAVLTPQAQVFGVRGARIESLGPGALPAAQRAWPGPARLDVPNYSWVEVEGTVRFGAAHDGVLHLEISEPNGRNGTALARMRVNILNWRDRPVAPLLNRKVRVQGVCERTLDATGQSAVEIIWVQDDQHLWPLDFSDIDGRGVEVLPMFEITPANLKLAWGRKVMVRGAVTSYDEKTRRVLLRGDDSFYAYSSTDGKTWTPFGTPIPVTMEDSVLIGLAATSITATQAFEATLSPVGLDLSRSQTLEIGGGPMQGSLILSNGTARFWPAGSRGWGKADGGMFVCQPLQEEGEITARIESFRATRNSDKAGLMVRESLHKEAPFVALVMTHGDSLDFLYRSSRGSVVKAVQREFRNVPGWLKLVRRRHTLPAQLLEGEILQLREQVELVGMLNWTNGEPTLADAHVRSGAKVFQPASADGRPRAVQVADLPSTAEENNQYANDEYLLRGVVTFKGRAFGRDFLFLQDESGAVPVRTAPPIFHREQIEAGCRLEVKGGVLFAPGRPPFRVNTATVLGRGAFPHPLPYPERSEVELVDSHWVETEGIVRSVTNNVMRVMGRNGPLLVWVGDSGSAKTLARYVDCLITVRGVLSLQAASEPVLFVPSPRFIEVTESAPDDLFVVPAFAINKLEAPNVNPNLLHRIKIIGAVTYRDADLLVVQDQTGGARVFGSGPGNVRVGDRVEVVGFPDREGDVLTMREPVIRAIGEVHPPEPIEMLLEGVLDGRLNGWLVRLEGIVLDQKTRQGRQLLELQNGQRVFQAVLAKGAGELKPLPAGSRVRVTGVSQLQVANRSATAATERDYPLVATMDVLMRSPADLVLLERPPWWTWRHTAAIGAVLGAILVGAMAWIRSLRRRVAQRTSELQVAMSQLQKETELSATLAERERLAAEIHDTLEQGLSGIMMQLDGADTRLANDRSGARENLELARRMVRFSRAEVRHSLWNLESQLLKDSDLGVAVKEIARQMSAESSCAISLEMSDRRFALPAVIEHHLLRCTQEAISNALKHSGATNVWVKLGYSAEQVELEIADDGSGFDAKQVLTGPGMHLGLRNLRSRARKMKGQLNIESEPGQGTTVRLTVPLTGRAEKAPASVQ